MDLFRSEWRRFRRLVIGIAAAHLMALALLSRTVDVTELGSGDQFAMLLVYMLLALTLAVLQVGGYRQPSRWLWLIHRPLSPRRIFAAIALASGAALAVAVWLPLVIFLVGIDTLTSQVVDLRHYGATLHALAFTMMAWLAGAHASTSRHRAAVAVLLAPLLLALRSASVWALLPLVLLSLCWMTFVALHGFRANRNAPLARAGVLLLTALPLQVAFFFLVFHVTKGGIALAGVIARGNTSRTVATGTDVMADIEAHLRRIGVAFWTKGLASSSDPRAPGWVDQLPTARFAGLASDIERFPVRHALGNEGGQWWDGRRGVKWTFSHDAMRYHGRRPGSDGSAGWWGVGGLSSAERYDEVPVGTLTRSALHVIDRDTLRQRAIITLPPGEWIAGRPVRAFDRVLLLTNRSLRVYARPRDTLPLASAPTLQWTLPVVDRGLPPITVDVAEVRDGWLVSLFFFDDWEFDGFESLLRPWQRVFHVDATGRATLVAERRDIRDHQVNLGITSPIPVASWWVSPPLYALSHLPDLVDDGRTRPPRFELLPRVPVLQGLAVTLMLLSAVGAWFWLRGARVTAGRRRLWLTTCFLLGVPAFLSLVCLEPRAPRGARSD